VAREVRRRALKVSAPSCRLCVCVIPREATREEIAAYEKQVLGDYYKSRSPQPAALLPHHSQPSNDAQTSVDPAQRKAPAGVKKISASEEQKDVKNRARSG